MDETWAHDVFFSDVAEEANNDNVIFSDVEKEVNGGVVIVLDVEEAANGSNVVFSDIELCHLFRCRVVFSQMLRPMT